MQDLSINISRTYRGYRLQALYSLHRILACQSTEIVFHPEGTEDLDIYNSHGRLLELVQVKSGGGPLSFSSISGFLVRACQEAANDIDVGLTLVSFGALGPELDAAFQGPGPERDMVVEKLKLQGVIPTQAQAVLGRVRPERFDEAVLASQVIDQLALLSVGSDTSTATDLLVFWMYKTAEAQERITRQSLAAVVDKVGRYVSERQLHHTEWGTAIELLDTISGEARDKRYLAEEFGAGVAARFEHIVASCDILRSERLQEIEEALKSNNVVIVRGASGQGKSTLCLRFLHDNYPACQRYQVRRVRDQIHAIRVAKALVSHVSALKLPATVLVDVHPSDTKWPDLVRELSRCPHLLVLVAIREEDFKRAELLGESFQYSDLVLGFDEKEARLLFSASQSSSSPGEFLGFEDAWDRFGGGGPLMEFTHLLREKQTLRERLRNQVHRLQDEVRKGVRSPSEMDLLRLVAVASSFGARLNLPATAQELGLVEAGRVVDSFEREYLIRRIPDGDLINGLHPIRSTLLVDLLSDPSLDPVEELMARCLSLVYPPDLFYFLLNGLSYSDQSRTYLSSVLTGHHPSDPTSAAAVMDALLWLGARRFADENAPIVQRAFLEEGSAWSLILDTCLPLERDRPGIPPFWESLPDRFSDERKAHLRELRDGLPDVTTVIVPTKQWLGSARSCISAPRNPGDWEALGRLLFWGDYLGVPLPAVQILAEADFASAVENLPLETLADLTLGLYLTGGEASNTLLAPHRSSLLCRYQEETRVVSLTVNDDRVDASFVVDLDDPRDWESPRRLLRRHTNPLHEMALRVVRVLRGIQPWHGKFGCRGYGHHVLATVTGASHDETVKDGMEPSAMPCPWVPRFNGTLLSLFEMPLRPEGWEEFAKSELEIRRSVVRLAGALSKALSVHFRKKRAVSPWANTKFAAEWSQFAESLSAPILLPRQAVDRFGFVSESGDRSAPGAREKTGEAGARSFVALQKTSGYLHQRNDLVASLRNFFHQAWKTGTRITAMGKGAIGPSERLAKVQLLAKHGIDARVLRLSLHNIREAVVQLPSFQTSFATTFSEKVSADDLDKLEKRERIVLQTLCNLWNRYVTSPRAMEQDAHRRWGQEDSSTIKNLRRKLQRTLTQSVGDGTRVCIPERLGSIARPCLCIVVEAEEPIVSFEEVEKILPIVRRFLDRSCVKPASRQAVELHWRDIHVLTTTNERVVVGIGWYTCGPTIPRESGTSDESYKAWRPLPVSDALLADFGLPSSDDPSMELPRRLFEETSKLALFLGHVAELASVPEPNEVGMKIMKEHIARTGEKIEDAYGQCIETLGAAFAELTGPDDAVPSDGPIHAVLLLIKEHFEALAPPNVTDMESFHIDLDGAAHWADKLQKAQVACLAILSHWTALKIEAP